MDLEAIIRKIENGKVGVMPTDTLYALAGSALHKEAINRIYSIKKRNPEKSLVILINSIQDLKVFGISISSSLCGSLDKLWPGRLSVALPVKTPGFEYLCGRKESPAFRVPDNKELRDLLLKTGPLAVPSANPEGLPPAKTIGEAKKYFGDSVDFYWDKGRLEGEPSTLIRIKSQGFEILRTGAYDPKRLKAALS